MSNLLVFLQLITMYLGENHVRVVCERVCTQEEPRDWQVAKGGTHVKHAGELKGHASCCTTGQNF